MRATNEDCWLLDIVLEFEFICIKPKEQGACQILAELHWHFGEVYN